ncbi:MAG: hypothetical protein ACI81V_000092 [Lentimonas sp.]|jgi:hypothetical protein
MAKKSKDTHPFWRPDFKISDTLPDIKVIRTNFLINFVAVMLPLVVAFYVLQREYRIYSLDNTIQYMRQEVAAAEAGNEKNLKMSAQFKAASKNIEELEKFYYTPILTHHLLAEFSRLKPDGLVLNAIKFDESLVKVGKKSSLVYAVSLVGLVKDPLDLEAFKAKLTESEMLNPAGYGMEIRESLMSRDVKTGIFPYSMSMVYNVLEDTAKGGAK